MTCRGSIPGTVATSSKACFDSFQLSPSLFPHPPNAPPPDEPTTYESVLTTPTPTDITDFHEDGIMVVHNVGQDDTEFENTTEDVSFM